MVFPDKQLSMKINDLLSYGFKELPINQYDKHDRQWQFCYRNKIGKKFFVLVRLWQFSRYSTKERPYQDGFDASCQFDMNGSRAFNVELSVNDMTPNQVVEWFDTMFDKLNCTYYERYDSECDYNLNNCNDCGAYLSSPILSNLCPKCLYKADTGFIKK